MSAEITELLDSFSRTLVSTFPPFPTRFIALNTLQTEIPWITRLHPHEGALIKLKEKSLTLFPLFPLAAWTIPLEQTRCGFTSPHTLQLLSLARDLQEVPWNDHLGKGSEAQRVSPSGVWRGVCPRSFHSPLFSVLARVLQGSHKQGTIPEPLTGSGLWFSSALAFVQEMRNRREPQQRHLW